MKFKPQNSNSIIQITVTPHNLSIKSSSGYMDELWVSYFDNEDAAEDTANIACNRLV